MNRKGFTLVELLAVIIILSLLALITGVAVTKIVKDSKEEISDIQKALILSAAKTWGADNINKLPDTGNCIYIRLQDIQNGGYISPNIIDSKTNSPIAGSVKIKISASASMGENPIFDYEVDPNSVAGGTFIGPYDPQYYTFAEGEIGEDLPNNRKKSASSLNANSENSFYLGFDTNDGTTVSAAYVCFIKNSTEYCLKGGQSSEDVFRQNQGILDEILPGACTLDDDSNIESIYRCSNNGISVNVSSIGYININDDNLYCIVRDDEYFDCHESYY